MIFSLRESDIETCGFSDIIFASKTGRSPISLGFSRISLRSNITRRKANITEKDDCESNRLFLVGAGGYSVPAPFRPLRAVLETFCVARDFTVPKAYRGFWAASTEPPSALLILYFLTKTKNQSIRTGSLFWWERVDSNHRSWKQQIYSLSPLATRELSQIFSWLFQARVIITQGW